MKYLNILILLVFGFSFLSNDDPRDDPSIAHVVYTQDNLTKFTQIGTANQVFTVNPSGTGFTWSDPGGLTPNSIDSTHIINGGISLDDITGSGIIDGALLQYDAINGWGGTSDPIITGTGGAGRVAYYSDLTTLSNESTFSYDSGSDRLRIGGNSAPSFIGRLSSTTSSLDLYSYSTVSPEAFDAGQINLFQATGSISTPADVGVTDARFGTLYARPYINGAFRLSASMYMKGSGATNVGNEYGTYIGFQTSDGTNALTDRMIINDDGQITFSSYTSASAYTGTTSHFVTQSSTGDILTKTAADFRTDMGLDAGVVPITDLAGYYGSTSVEGALQDLGEYRESKAFLSVVGGSTSFVSGTPERLDGDTPGTTTDVNSSSDWTVSASRCTYTGTNTYNFNVHAEISSSLASVGQATYYIAKNGTIIGTGKTRDHGNTDIGNIRVTWIVNMATNDYVEVFVDAIADETCNVSSYSLEVRRW